jgi:hypothetical protein
MGGDLSQIPTGARNPAKKVRGTILVDANIFYNLYAAVDSAFRPSGSTQAKLRRYIDGLKFLSHHGYDILIPEMVAYETENVISTGDDVDRYFRRSDDTRDKVYRADMKKFFKDVAKGKKYPNIQMIPTDEPYEAAAFLQRVHEIIARNPRPSAQATRQLVSIQRRQRDDFGDRAIEAILGHDEIRTYHQPFFILSDDHEVETNSAKYPDVNIVNTRGFIDAFIRSGLWEGLGLAGGVTSEQVMQSIGEQNELATGIKNLGFRANIDMTAGDYTHRYIRHDGKASEAHPLTSSLRGLAYDLGWDARSREVANKANSKAAPRISPVESFVRKYGKKPTQMAERVETEQSDIEIKKAASVR